MFEPEVGDRKAIFYDDVIVTWFRRQSLKFHEGLFFAIYTLSRPERALIRAPRRKLRGIVRITYSGTTRPASCGNSGFQMCKVGASLYTDFTPAVRMKVTMRSIIGAVI